VSLKIFDASLSRYSTRLSHCASRGFTEHILTSPVKENRAKYKHLDFKEQQKELGKEVCLATDIAHATSTIWVCNVLAVMSLTWTVENLFREPKEQHRLERCFYALSTFGISHSTRGFSQSCASVCFELALGFLPLRLLGNFTFDQSSVLSNVLLSVHAAHGGHVSFWEFGMATALSLKSQAALWQYG
jgi:hypothetical protein